MNKLAFVLAFICFQNSVFGYLDNNSLDQFAGKLEMNGFLFSDFGQFEKNWKLVTVRYRQDTGELRFTYANPKAWKAMSSGKAEYPDGSIFAKTGYMTDDDPSFTSSKIPSGSRRYQFMVKNKKKYKDQDGWGYALFD